MIVAMNDVKIYIVGTKTTQGTFYLPTNGFFGKMSLVKEDLGSDHHLIARDPVFECFAQICFAAPV